MKLSRKGLNLIKKYEGLRLSSYKADPSEAMWTIGYGHYGVGPNLKITEQEAEIYLIKDLSRAEICVNGYDHIYHFNQNQFDALVSFAFNIGSIKQLTASGTRTIEEISKKILEYNKCGGKALAGLTRRRKEEQKLFNTPVASTIPGEEPSLLTIAQEVIDGKWGNGDIRKRKLQLAGYDYKTIQKLVNQLLKQ